MERARMRDNAWQGFTEWLTPMRVSQELEVDYHRVLSWLKREKDPLPSVLLDGNKKQSRIKREELNKWIERNSKPVE